MSRTVFYIGPSGSGKTSAMRTLNPETTFIFNALGKELPWKGSAKQYKYWNKEEKTGNMVKTSHTKAILAWLDFINKEMPWIKDICIDDHTFLTSLELQRRSKEEGWGKFNDIAQNFLDLAEKCKTLREDLVIHIMHHTQISGDGIVEDKQYRAMSYGKLLDEKLGTQEAQFTVVLRSAKENNSNHIEYVFYTADPNSSAKAPFEMFNEATIPNDMNLVSTTLRCYYDDDCVESEDLSKEVKKK